MSARPLLLPQLLDEIANEEPAERIETRGGLIGNLEDPLRFGRPSEPQLPVDGNRPNPT